MVDQLKKYVIEKTRGEPYLDKTNNVINGFIVTVLFVDFDEMHEIKVPDMKTETVKNAIELLLSERNGLQNLG